MTVDDDLSLLTSKLILILKEVLTLIEILHITNNKKDRHKGVEIKRDLQSGTWLLNGLIE